jgi:hypothetical protein
MTALYLGSWLRRIPTSALMKETSEARALVVPESEKQTDAGEMGNLLYHVRESLRTPRGES